MEQKQNYNLTVPEKSTQLEISLKNCESRSSEIIRDYTNKSTKRAFQGDMAYWQAWLSAIGFNFKTDTITVSLIKYFIIQHLEAMNPEVDKILFNKKHKSKLGTHSLKTVKRRISTLSIFFEMDKLYNPCADKEVKLLIKRFNKIHAGRVRKKKAITKDILEDMLSTCKEGRLIDIRDKAILLFAFASGGRRRSEVVEADMKDLLETADGDYIYNLSCSKTNKEGKDDYKPVKGRASKALRDWLEASNVKKGSIFRSIGKGGDVRGSLSGIEISRIVKRRVDLAGYDKTYFAGHSIRRGFVTEGGRQGKPIADIMSMTSHKSVATVMEYYESGNIINNSCAELMG